jgi:hypothetical protein
MRFGVGVALGASIMYWYLTGQVPYRSEIMGWLDNTATAYKGDVRKSEADRLIPSAGTARRP